MYIGGNPTSSNNLLINPLIVRPLPSSKGCTLINLQPITTQLSRYSSNLSVEKLVFNSFASSSNFCISISIFF